MGLLTSHLAPVGGAFCLFSVQVISANAPPFPGVGGVGVYIDQCINVIIR